MNYQLTVAVVPLPPMLLKALSGEFKGVLANYLLLEAASFIGSDTQASDWEWDAVARLLDQSSVLDPYFKQTYTLAQGTLPWYANKTAETLNILERSKIHRAWDWIPGFFIGFNFFYFHQDYLMASKALMEASQVPNAPAHLATWAGRLASQAGQHKAAIDFLSGMYENTDDEQQRAMLSQRIEALQGAYELQEAVDSFIDQTGRLPNSFDELMDCGLVSQMPANPYHRPYTLKEGKVHF